MPKNYWAQVLAFETSEYAEKQYKILDEKLRDLLKDRCLLSELNLDPSSNYDERVSQTKRVANKSEVIKKRLSVRQIFPKPEPTRIQNYKNRLSDSFLEPIKLVSIKSTRVPSARLSIMSKKRGSLSIQY